MFVAVIW